MAVAGVVIGGASLIAGVVSAVAAVRAAKYAEDSPTKADLQKVEQNTAHSVEQIRLVRQEVSDVKEHLSEDRARYELQARADRLSISVTGSCRMHDTLLMRFVLMESDVILTRVDLRNKNGMIAGAVECIAAGERTFTALADGHLTWRWFGLGKQVEDVNERGLIIRAHLLFNHANSARKDFAAILRQTMDPDVVRGSGNVVVFYLHGEC